MCNLAGRTNEAAHYLAIATKHAAQWQTLAADAGHTRLAYDQPGTWSMKHNLIWDRVLGLGLFPDSVGDTEIAWYLNVQNTYGLPVDNRTTTCLIDWAAWSIALARYTNDFQNLVAPLFNYANATPSRVPLSDWFQTTTAAQQAMQARPVVGGLFVKMITDKETWTNWFHQGEDVSGPWAQFPIAGRYTEIVSAAQNQEVTWRYTTTDPATNWFTTAFDDSAWPQGFAGFGTAGTPGAVVRTTWNTSNIWIRRAFVVTNLPTTPRLLAHHDETAEVYVNGVVAAVLPGYTTSYGQFRMTPASVAALCTGTNVLAVHCVQTAGGQYIDVGIADEPAWLTSSAPASTNLVAFWPLNVDTSDVLGAHNGQLVGNTNRAIGPEPLQGALYLDGTSFVKTGTSYGSLFDGSNPFSATAWVRGDTNNNDSTIIGKMAQGGDYTGWELHVGTTDLGSGPGKLNVWLINSYGANYIQVNSPMRVLDGTWHHAVFTYDGSRQAAGVKIYVDGQEATGSIAVNSLTGSLQNSVDVDLGTRQNGAFHNFTGALREVSLWDIALTPEDVAHIFQKGVPTEGVPLRSSRFTPPPGS